MAAIATSLSKSIPKPKYTGDEEDLPTHTKSRGPRIVGPDALGSEIAIRRTGPPPYGQRAGWIPRGPEDFGDGGAFPEIRTAQYPLDMGRKSASSSKALAIKVDSDGKVDYSAIAKQGHSDSRIIHSSFKDLIPLRQRADVGEISLERPSEEEVQNTKEKTQQALAALVSGAVAAQNPKNVQGRKRDAPQYVRYTPSSNQMGDYTKKQDRIVKIVQRQQDPMEPPKFKHKKIPRGPPSPPPPVMQSPPRKLTAEDQEAWKIPPSVSNWKNPKGYTVPLDKRLASDGRGLQDVTINDKFSQLSEALYTADRHAREEVKQRAAMQQKLAEKEKAQREDALRAMAQKARAEKEAMAKSRRSRSRSRSRGRGRSDSYDSSSTDMTDSEEEAEKERTRAREQRGRERERELRKGRMGHERRMQVMAREQGRDISEKIALGLAKPTASAESMYDSRLFNQSSGLAAGFNEDQPYDKPLFMAQDALNSIYRTNVEQDDEEGAEDILERLKSGRKFDGFKAAADAEKREGPVQFEKDRTIGGASTRGGMAKGGKEDDPFNITEMINDVTGRGGTKRAGEDRGEKRESKRPKVDDDSD